MLGVTSVWDCLKEEFKECHTTHKKKGFRKGELYHLAGTASNYSATIKKKHATTSFTWVGTKDCEVIFLNGLHEGWLIHVKQKKCKFGRSEQVDISRNKNKALLLPKGD